MYELLKKKYSQNFLIDKNICKKICSLITNSHKNIIEIGPGDGRLTDVIIGKKPNNLTLVEIDQDLISILKSKYANKKNIKIIENDILKYDLDKKYDLIISNLPYKISSQIIVKIILLNYIPQTLILMFQKEFAERILSKKLNSLNTLVNCFYDIDKSFNVSKNCFRPIPKVESKVLLFNKKKKILLKKNDIENFINFKRKIFSHKRKSLKFSLKNFNMSSHEFDLTERPEDLDMKTMISLFEKIIL